MTNHPSLRDLAQRFALLGYAVGERNYPEPHSLFVAVKQPPAADDPHGVVVLENMTFLYAKEDHWEAWFADHGGPHWRRAAATLDELEEIVFERLRDRGVGSSGKSGARGLVRAATTRSIRHASVPCVSLGPSSTEASRPPRNARPGRYGERASSGSNSSTQRSRTWSR